MRVSRTFRKSVYPGASPTDNHCRNGASTADLKSLQHKRRIRSGTSDRLSGTGINKLAGTHDFPKFVKVGAAMEHELRKSGPLVRRGQCDIRHMPITASGTSAQNWK